MIKHHFDIQQGTPEWHAMRCGMLTASAIKIILTPAKLQLAKNEEVRNHVFDLLAQRVTKFVEPEYQGYDMMRGATDEVEARIEYNTAYAPVTDCGFITNDKWGFTLGYSPDGLIGDDGLIEAKSRKQKYQFRTIIEQKVPDEYRLQVQAGLLISERAWCDFISYPANGGTHMTTMRILPDFDVQKAIIDAATVFEKQLDEQLAAYNMVVAESQKTQGASNVRLVMTKYRAPDDAIKV